MASKKIKTSRGILFARLLLASAVLLFIPHRQTGKLNFLFFKLFDPVLTFAQGKNPIEFLDDSFVKDNFISLREHNKIKNKIYKEYANALGAMAKLHDDYEKLSKVRTTIPNDDIGIVIADKMKASLTGRSELIVNKGSLDGVEKGQYVLVQEGNCVIGTVVETSESQAKIKLVTDSKHYMPIIIHRLGTMTATPAQLIGNGAGQARIPLMPSKEYDIRPGDLVFAAKNPAFQVDAEIIIGKVSEVEIDKKEPHLLNITVEPIEDFSEINTVAIVVMKGLLKFK